LESPSSRTVSDNWVVPYKRGVLAAVRSMHGHHRMADYCPPSPDPSSVLSLQPVSSAQPSDWQEPGHSESSMCPSVARNCTPTGYPCRSPSSVNSGRPCTQSWTSCRDRPTGLIGNRSAGTPQSTSSPSSRGRTPKPSPYSETWTEHGTGTRPITATRPVLSQAIHGPWKDSGAAAAYDLR
jgi:hypothetical protein